MPNAHRYEGLHITAFATSAAIVYGILHDQVTAHVCVEYFTIAHPPVFPTTSPFLLAIGWGVIATWWVGLPLGVALALAARVGGAPRLTLLELRLPILVLMLTSGVLALISGLVGAALVASGLAEIPGGWAETIPPAKHVAFSADAWAHVASYASGAVGGLILIAHTVWRRHVRSTSDRSTFKVDGL